MDLGNPEKEAEGTVYRYDAPCGLYCGACGTILADRKGTVEALAEEWGRKPEELVCHGCKSETTAVFCRTCTFRDCVASRGIDYCFQCGDFPCEALAGFRDDPAPHHSVVVRNGLRMREVGLERWLEEQRVRWSCPDCGEPFFWYDASCRTCGASLRDCRAEEAEEKHG